MLSFITCPDQEDSVFEKEKVSAVADLQQPGHEDSDLDLCSPLCSCQCCHTHYQVYNLHFAEYLPLPGEKQNSFYTNNFRFSLSYMIWQPPKV
jgi:hypothetical protein